MGKTASTSVGDETWLTTATVVDVLIRVDVVGRCGLHSQFANLTTMAVLFRLHILRVQETLLGRDCIGALLRGYLGQDCMTLALSDSIRTLIHPAMGLG